MKLDFKKGILKNTLIYTLTDGLSKALSFVLLPIVSRFLAPEQLGIAANFDVVQNVLMLLAGQAIVNALPYFYYKLTKRQTAILVSNLLMLIIVTCVILANLIFFVSDIIENYLHIGIALQLLTIVSAVAYLLSGVNLVLYRLEDKPYSFSNLQILQSLLYILLTIILVVNLQMGALGRIYSIVCTYVMMAIIHITLLARRHYLVLKIDKASMKILLKFGIPLLPHSLSFWIKGGMDKILLTTFCGLAINGLYSMAMSFGAIYTIFYQAFSNAFVPYLQKRISLMKPETEKEEKLFLVRLSYKIGGGFIILYFIIVGCCWLVIYHILDPKYYLSFQFIPYIMLASTINSFYGLFVQYPYTVKKTFGLGIITFSGSLIQLLLTYFFVRGIGSDGIKFSLVIGALIIMLGVWWYSNRVYPMPWLSCMRHKH